MSEPLPHEGDAATGLGPMLRRARELRELSEQQAAEQLNLDVSVVTALEREDFAALGAPVFARGHLRRYGALVGIREEALLEAYQRAQGQPDAPSLIPRARIEMSPVRARPRWPLVTGGLLAFVLAAGVTAYVAEFGLHLPGGDAGVAAGPGVAPAAADPGAAQAGTGSTGGGSVAAPDPVATAPAPTLPVPAGYVSVTLAFTTDSWAEIYDGSGKAVLYDLGRSGTQRTIAAAAPLSVTFGNAPGVALHVNGRPAAIPAPLAGGTVTRFRIDADGTVR